MKKYLFIFSLLSFVLCPLSLMAKPAKQTVVLSCDLHCQGCCDKVMKNIAYEKGVKDLSCDLKAKTVTVTYDAAKTDIPTLLKAFDKINKPARVKEEPVPTTNDKRQTTNRATDAESGASKPNIE